MIRFSELDLPMKFFVAALFCVLSSVAFAQSEQDQSLACRIKGEIFESAASSRDSGRPPELALNMVSAYLSGPPLPGVTKEFMKNAINSVYFHPDFANAGGPRLSGQITELCMTGGKPRYQPLK